MTDPDLLDEAALPGKFAVYQRFNRREDLEYVVGILRDHRIPVRTSDGAFADWREAIIIGNPLEPTHWVEIPVNRFEQANFLLREAAEAEISETDISNHPFAAYPTAELQEVLLHESDWSPEAVVIARQLLLRSGVPVDLAALRQAHRDRLAAEFRPKRGSFLSLSIATLIGVLSGLILWFVGIMFTLGILLYYRVGTRLDPKGVRHWAYVALTRRWALWGLVLVGGGVLCGMVNFFFLQWGLVAEVDGWLWWWR